MLTLHFDLTSPASAVAVLRLHRLAEAGGRVGFAGIDVLGLATAIPATLDQLDELERVRGRAAALGLVMHRPALRPPTLPAHLVGALAEELGVGAVWRARCLSAYWTDGADLGSAPVLVELAGSVGIEAASVEALLADRRRRAALARRMTEARHRGVGGVPVLEVDGTFVPADLDDAELAALAAL